MTKGSSITFCQLNRTKLLYYNMEENYGLIYKITNTINGKLYIGQTVRIKMYLQGRYKGSGVLLKKAKKKYGIENFKIEIVCYAYSQQELNTLETHYIRFFDTVHPKGYNLTNEGTAHQDTRKKLAKASTGRIKKPEEIEKIIQANKGRTISKEQKEAISKFNKGKIVSEETRQKLRMASMGRKKSKEEIEKMKAGLKETFRLKKLQTFPQ